MLDNTLIPAYQDRVALLTFTTEHSSTHLHTDDPEGEEHCEELLLMTGRGAENMGEQRNKNNYEVMHDLYSTKHNAKNQSNIEVDLNSV